MADTTDVPATESFPTGPEPARARPVFSSEDFTLIREAVRSHLKQIQDQPDSIKYANLYHRLGRFSPA